ncbi:amidohydrolase family protein [Streptomyces sp. BE20]|uniref:amidohydrolase family protein n=1 Tax=Streptomyces sp. BE20 TaxID=3002525 RepID=UPI003FA6930B
MLTLHRAARVLPDPADPTAPSYADGAVLVRGELIEAVGPYDGLAAEHPAARVRDWGDGLLTPGLRNPYGRWLLECAYHPDPREGIGDEPVPGGPEGLGGPADEARCGASARRGLQRMLGFGVTAVAGPFERASVRTAVARSGLGVPGGAGVEEGPLDPLAVLPFVEAVHGRLGVGGRADFAVFAPGADGPRAGGCLATVLAGRLVFRRR